MLKDKELLEQDRIITADFALYEIINTIWKHQFLLKDLKDGGPYVSILYGLIESGRIQLVQFNQELMEKTYAMASRNKTSVYDAAFIVLAKEAGLELMTRDVRQAEIMKKLK